MLLSVPALLDGAEEADTLAIILDDSIDESEGVHDEGLVAANLLNNLQERLDESFALLIVLARVEELTLLLVAHLHEILDHLAGALDDCVVLYSARQGNTVRHSKCRSCGVWWHLLSRWLMAS